ncbi:MAG: pilus assembly protein PilP, partial [Kofleriaceae bacterium]
AYTQVEALAADEKEAKSLRHQFRETDFQVDPTGTVNRDPFRSYVINQPGVSSTDTTLTAQPTELCPAKKQIANTYMARELKLVGIVARGTERTALFSDTAQKGHLVKRNDCIGKEKGRVVEIGAAYAKAEISADPLPGQPPRPPDIIIYQLYPEQLPINPDDTSGGPAPKGS